MSAYLTYEERLEIEGRLKDRSLFGEIGRYLAKDRIVMLVDHIKREQLK